MDSNGGGGHPLSTLSAFLIAHSLKIRGFFCIVQYGFFFLEGFVISIIFILICIKCVFNGFIERSYKNKCPHLKGYGILLYSYQSHQTCGLPSN